jgi:hypothetical protein
MHRKVAAAFVAALALGVASCGSSEPPLTRAQLVSRVEAACRAGQQASQRQARTSSGSSRSANALAFVEAVVAGQKVAIDRIEDLNAPDEVKDTFDSFKQSMQQRADLFDRVKSAGAANLQRAMTTAQRDGEALSKRLQQAVRDLGVEGCS